MGIEPGGHSLALFEREKFTGTGIKHVVSFHDDRVALETSMGLLEIRGKDLNITSLDLEKGEICIAGTVTSMSYGEPGSTKRSFWQRVTK